MPGLMRVLSELGLSQPSFRKRWTRVRLEGSLMCGLPYRSTWNDPRPADAAGQVRVLGLVPAWALTRWDDVGPRLCCRTVGGGGACCGRPLITPWAMAWSWGRCVPKGCGAALVLSYGSRSTWNDRAPHRGGFGRWLFSGLAGRSDLPHRPVFRRGVCPYGWAVVPLLG